MINRVSYHVGLDFAKNDNDLLIFDESDVLLFETPDEFNSFVKENPCICLTATPGGGTNTLEKKVLEHMAFQILEDQESSQPLTVKKVIKNVHEYIQSQQRCVLVFCKEDMAD